jgi:hypothetical protein
MTLNRILTLATLFILAAVLVYALGTHHLLRRPPVFVAGIPNQREAQVAQVKEYLREACPEVVLITDQRRADYRLMAVWNDTQGWVAVVSRKDSLIMFHREGADAMEVFRQSCAAIRDDAKESQDFDASMQSMPVGRYSLNAANPDHVFLLDTKTGAVWQLKPQPLGDSQEFERTSVEGLYNTKVGVGP